MPTVATPKVWREGTVPSSFQTMVEFWPPTREEVSVGDVMNTVAIAEEAAERSNNGVTANILKRL